jgi:hypothetical protein
VFQRLCVRCTRLGNIARFHRLHNGLRLHAHRRHAHEEVNHFFFVISESVGIEFFADGGVFGFLFFVLVKHPFEGGAAAEFVFPKGIENIVYHSFVVDK